MRPAWQALLWGVGLSTSFELVYFLACRWRARRDAALKDKEPSREVSEVLFFPDRAIVSRKRGRRADDTAPQEGDASPASSGDGGDTAVTEGGDAHPAAGVGGFAKLVEQLRVAERSIDVSIFCFTSRHLREVLVEKQRQGVYIRVVGDRSKGAESDSQFHALRAAGIEVRENDGSFFMHHKFAVMDDRVLINGSFNWSHNAITGNNENVLMTSDPRFVAPYKAQFEALWAQFDPRAEYNPSATETKRQ